MENPRDIFNEKLDELYTRKRYNSFLLNAEKYDALVAKLEDIAKNGPKSRKDYSLRKSYEVHVVSDSKRIFKTNNNKQVLRMDEMFDTMQQIHCSKGHAGRNIMLKALEKYANVTQEIVMQFLNLCETCQLKSKKARKHLVVKPIVSNDFNHRCQMDLINMQSSSDGEYNHILVYQDNLTKFVQLRALKSKSQVLNLFKLWRTPDITLNLNKW